MQYSVIRTSELDKIVFRLDAEYYHPDNINLEKKLTKFPSISVRNANGVFDCSAFYPSIVPYYNFDKIGVPFLRVNEIQDGMLHLAEDTAFLPQELLDENKSTIAKCKQGDLIIAKGGNSLAKVAFLTDDHELYSVCRDIIVLRTQNIEKLNKYYLWMFLHSQIGQKLLLRTASQTGQPHLTIEALYQLEIPLFSENFQDSFELLYVQSQETNRKSENLYIQAQTILLSELSLANWQPKNQLSFVKNYSDTQQAGRIDAEYFQPKYEDIIEKINMFDVLELSDTKYFKILTGTYTKEYSSESKYYIRSVDINNDLTIETDNMYRTKEKLESRFKVREGDIVTSRVGSIGTLGYISKELDGSYISDNILRIRNNHEKLDNLFLAFFLKQIGSMLMDRLSRGSVQQRLNQETLKEIKIPLIDVKIQEKISCKIRESHRLKKLSKQLLESAKRAVEIAIEQDEETAIKWLKEQTEEGNF